MNILAIDDEELTQNFIQQVLQKEYAVRLASNGEEGIALAPDLQPDLIILDVNMPGMNGYEVCEELKKNPATLEIPVLFLSANNDLEEEMKGYQAGGDDYLVKPCEPKTLLAKVNVMLRYKSEREKLNAQYQDAQKTAHIAMVGSSEIGMAMQLVEASFLINTYEELATSFFSLTNNLGLTCAIMFFTQDGPKAFFSDGSFSPLEEELLQKMKDQQRIIDFRNRTFINYPNTTLLVKNMPTEDKERYGRIKDLLPTVLGSISNKVLAMKTGHIMQAQAIDMKVSFDRIKTTLLNITNSISDNSKKNNLAMRKLFENIQDFMPKLALEEDQETFILDYIEETTKDSTALNANSSELIGNLHSVVNTLQFVVDRQQDLAEELNNDGNKTKKEKPKKASSSDIDFF
ncbi:MAG: response regulator [Gammaproteobacteria bacterium]|nr:response regulator [Gammaproteobacteria bacterium]